MTTPDWYGVDFLFTRREIGEVTEWLFRTAGRRCRRWEVGYEWRLGTPHTYKIAAACTLIVASRKSVATGYGEFGGGVSLRVREKALRDHLITTWRHGVVRTWVETESPAGVSGMLTANPTGAVLLGSEPIPRISRRSFWS